MLTDITYTTITAGTTDAQAIAATTDLRLMGWSVRESAGSPAAATLNLRHGTSASDPVVAGINLAASGVDSQWFGPQGLPADAGIYLDRLTGNTTVTLLTAIA
jgi:hypothetical protein